MYVGAATVQGGRLFEGGVFSRKYGTRRNVRLGANPLKFPPDGYILLATGYILLADPLPYGSSKP